ncbi:hypothetical protein C2G38_2234280 [Gigaspora rosea]|uniref:Uncharacterized protein n=1 Tax=Gigaspora rosea TaxID=44941 RepID=A0A397TQI9_9GLOM|nr:hypothetical protein C2G38_2234280 [Gigaspora rosea]
MSGVLSRLCIDEDSKGLVEIESDMYDGEVEYSRLEVEYSRLEVKYSKERSGEENSIGAELYSRILSKICLITISDSY